MKKILWALLGAGLIFTFVACNNGTKPSDDENSNAAKSSKTVNPDRGVYGLLTGIVVDSYTAAPVEGVTVSIDGTNYKFITKADGAYYFDKVPVGEYNIIYSKDGYRAYTTATPVVVNPTQFLDDDPFYKKTVIDALLEIADKVVDNDKDFSSTELTNGTQGSSTINKTDADPATGDPATTEIVSKTTSGTGTTEDNTFNFEWFVEDIDNYEYKYGIPCDLVKLVKLGATVKGKLVGYIPHGSADGYENFENGTGYEQEITRGTTVALSGVTLYATVVDSGNANNAELDGDVWKTTSDASGNFEFRDLPVGTKMKIGFTAFDKTIEGVNYSFLNSNVEYRDSDDVNAADKNFVTLDATIYATEKDGDTLKEVVEVNNVLDISSIYVKAVAPKPYVVETNGIAKGKANPGIGTGDKTPIAVTDSVTVTFNMEMDPTGFNAFYTETAPADDASSVTATERMLAEWSEDYKTVSLKRAKNDIFKYTAVDSKEPVGYIEFANATAKAHTSTGFEAIAIYTVEGIALAKENAVTYIAADKVPARAALNELDALPYLGAVKLTFTKPIDKTAENKFKVYIDTRLRTTQSWKQIEASDIIYGKDADANSVYIKADGLEKASVAKIEYKVFSTDPKDSIDNFTATDDNTIIFRTSDSLVLASTNLYGEEENVYYNSLSTGDFGTKVFKLTEDIKLTFTSDIPTGAKIVAELYKKDDIAAESTIGGIKENNIVTSATAAGKVITIKHDPLELNTEYVFGIKVISNNFVCFNTKSSVWAQLFTVNSEDGTIAEANDGLISNVALTIENAENKDAESYYIWFKTAPSSVLKLYDVDAYNYNYAYQTTKETVEHKLLVGTEDIVLTFEDEPYAILPADDDCYNVSIVAAKTDNLDEGNLITSIAIDTDANTLTISHEDFDELSTYYLSLEVFADNTLEDKIFTTVGGTFEGKDNAIRDGNFITIKTAEAKWQLVKANVYNYGENDKYVGIDNVTTITGVESEAIFEADSAITLTFNKNISIADKDVTVVLISEDNVATDKDYLPTAKEIVEDSVACTYSVDGSVLTITPSEELEAGTQYWLYVSVVDKEDDTLVYFETSEAEKTTYAIDSNVYFENADSEDDDIFIGFEVYKEPNKVFVLTDTNLVDFDADSNIYYDANTTTASTSIDFGLSTAITLTFTEALPADAVITAELYPVNVIGGLENNPVELLARNVVTAATKAGDKVTVTHSPLIPETDYAFAVKVTAAGYDDFYTKALATITCEPRLRDDDNNQYFLIANTQIDSTTDGSYYIVFNTEDGFTALVGDDYATNIAIDGTTANFPATDEDIVIEVNKDISSATNDIKVYWGETKQVAEAKTRETTLTATVAADKNDTTSIITIDNTTTPVTLVPGYFYNVVIDSDDEVLSYVFQVSNEKVKGTEGTSHFTINDASSVDSSTDKVNVDFSPAGNNYGLTKMYRFFYEYGVYDTTASDYVFSNDVADWIPVNGTSGALMIDNPNYLAQRYSNYTDEYELSFDKGKETTTGRELPWIQFENNAIKFIEQYIGTNGFLYYKDVQSGIIKDVVLVEPTITNTSSLTTTSTNVTSASYRVTSNEIMEIQNVTLLGQFVGGQYTITYDATYKAATITITVSSAIDAAVGDGITVTITDLANNTPVNKTRVLE